MSDYTVAAGVVGPSGRTYVGQVTVSSESTEDFFNFDKTDMYQVVLDEPMTMPGHKGEIKKVMVAVIGSELLMSE